MNQIKCNMQIFRLQKQKSKHFLIFFEKKKFFFFEKKIYDKKISSTDKSVPLISCSNPKLVLSYISKIALQKEMIAGIYLSHCRTNYFVKVYVNKQTYFVRQQHLKMFLFWDMSIRNAVRKMKSKYSRTPQQRTSIQRKTPQYRTTFE